MGKFFRIPKVTSDTVIDSNVGKFVRILSYCDYLFVANVILFVVSSFLLLARLGVSCAIRGFSQSNFSSYNFTTHNDTNAEHYAKKIQYTFVHGITCLQRLENI
jgi:hypothetical protein